MDLDSFNATPLAAKRGLYLIHNPDSRRGPHWVKLAHATVPFATRLGVIGTGLPLGFKVSAVLTVPNHLSAGFSGAPTSRVRDRETEAHKLLLAAPGIVRQQRHTGRTSARGLSEWFRPANGPGDAAFIQKVITRTFRPMAARHGDSKLFVCDRFRCRAE